MATQSRRYKDKGEEWARCIVPLQNEAKMSAVHFDSLLKISCDSERRGEHGEGYIAGHALP